MGNCSPPPRKDRWRGQRSWRGRGPLVEHALMASGEEPGLAACDDRWTGTGMRTRQLSQSVRRVRCPRMRGGGPCREGGAYRVCWSGLEDGDVPELRLLAPQQARCPTELWEGRPVQCTRVRVCMRGVRGTCCARVSYRSARTVGVCVGAARRAPSVDRLSVCGSCVELLRVPALGQSMVRDRSGDRSRSADVTCMYV